MGGNWISSAVSTVNKEIVRAKTLFPVQALNNAHGLRQTRELLEAIQAPLASILSASSIWIDALNATKTTAIDMMCDTLSFQQSTIDFVQDLRPYFTYTRHTSTNNGFVLFQRFHETEIQELRQHLNLLKKQAHSTQRTHIEAKLKDIIEELGDSPDKHFFVFVEDKKNGKFDVTCTSKKSTPIKMPWTSTNALERLNEMLTRARIINENLLAEIQQNSCIQSDNTIRYVETNELIVEKCYIVAYMYELRDDFLFLHNQLHQANSSNNPLLGNFLPGGQLPTQLTTIAEALAWMNITIFWNYGTTRIPIRDTLVCNIKPNTPTEMVELYSKTNSLVEPLRTYLLEWLVNKLAENANAENANAENEMNILLERIGDGTGVSNLIQQEITNARRQAWIAPTYNTMEQCDSILNAIARALVGNNAQNVIKMIKGDAGIRDKFVLLWHLESMNAANNNVIVTSLLTCDPQERCRYKVEYFGPMTAIQEFVEEEDEHRDPI